MKNIKNIFGEDAVCDEEDLRGYTYATCTACMSIYSEFLSWANYVHEIQCNQFITTSSDHADNIVVLSCQVTDLAILNDFRTLEKLMAQFPKKKFFIGGCLANRFDIELPQNVNRLGRVCTDYNDLDSKYLVDFADPFWVKNFKDNSNEFSEGNLFRNKYPLRIGVGCNKKCSYCTIRHTRGTAYELPIQRLIDEFMLHEDVVLIADNPSAEQITAWCHLSLALNKKISIRNIEPSVFVECEKEIRELMENNLLDVLHCPIQSNNVEVLKDMKRSALDTTLFISFVEMNRKFKTTFATNIIVDYKDFPNPTNLSMFDYVSWNPYWDGIWNRQRAEERYKKYIEEDYKP